MTDREKILRGAECCRREPSANGCPKECPYLPKRHFTCGLDPFLDDVIALLKEQEPVKPIENAGFYYCGACKYAFTSARQKYCSDCGKAVKWDAAD